MNCHVCGSHMYRVMARKGFAGARYVHFKCRQCGSTASTRGGEVISRRVAPFFPNVLDVSMDVKWGHSS